MTPPPKSDKPATCGEPTREELDADLAIPADFDTVLDRIMAGRGTDDGNHSV